MNDAEETIERLLTGLRVAEPPAGLQRRVLAAMEAREVVVSPPSWGLALALGAVMMAALLIVTIAVRRHPQWHQHSTSVAAREPTPPQNAPMKRWRVRAAGRRPRAHVRAVSYPAPALPLTGQEKLLLRLAHGRDANNIAVLNPELRAAQTAKAAVQFQQFFDIDPKEMRSQIE